MTIEVKNLDEKPVLMVRTGPVINNAPTFRAATAARSVAENTPAGRNIDAPVVARDEGALTYTLRGADAASFTIGVTTGQLRTRSALDYETKNSYTVTVRAADDEGANGEIIVTITVTNVDEPGKVTLSSANPRVGTALTASLTDSDDVTAGSVTWRWASSNAMKGAYSNISGATSDSYTPVTGDENMYLRAMVSYTDGEASGKSAQAESANAVLGATAAPTTGSEVGDRYDTNDDGMIEGSEVIQAVRDYFANAITAIDVLEVVGLYFDSR